MECSTQSQLPGRSGLALPCGLHSSWWEAGAAPELAMTSVLAGRGTDVSLPVGPCVSLQDAKLFHYDP